ncbi:twitching motility protein PilT [Prochlorothrix hollandica PCC 9006 = CALU 1027]|uniref:Ribonuclease VapC n=1 Tax=Prochlorothrix hollandica PCC 9006 = CALU 1027 TaxID=317619 RepID=A0A0M2PN06_PROHO|nr:twitching motility protein PilT [Prochlorothrix hollandica PCC 9006 = CALU 1027]
MVYLLDTNICIYLLNRHGDSELLRRFSVRPPSDFKLCSIVKSELYYGAYKSRNFSQNLLKLERFFQEFESLSLDDKAAQLAGNIRSHLSKLGTPIGPNDLLIAAIALAHNLTLITHNTREFDRVNGLQYEDWEAV